MRSLRRHYKDKFYITNCREHKNNRRRELLRLFLCSMDGLFHFEISNNLFRYIFSIDCFIVNIREKKAWDVFDFLRFDFVEENVHPLIDG